MFLAAVLVPVHSVVHASLHTSGPKRVHPSEHDKTGRGYSAGSRYSGAGGGSGGYPGVGRCARVCMTARVYQGGGLGTKAGKAPPWYPKAGKGPPRYLRPVRLLPVP